MCQDGRTFPHPFGTPDDGLFYTRVVVSPEGDRLTADFARQLLVAEELGTDDTPDYLAVSFSGPDAVNHFFGPSSLENEDVVRQLEDRGILREDATEERPVPVARGGGFALRQVRAEALHVEGAVDRRRLLREHRRHLPRLRGRRPKAWMIRATSMRLSATAVVRASNSGTHPASCCSSMRTVTASSKSLRNCSHDFSSRSAFDAASVTARRIGPR